jgi:hypothetical protein
MTPEKEAFWQGALNMCAVLAVCFFAVWVLLSPLRNLCPTIAAPVAAPAPVETTDARQERLAHKLCDKEVEILMESRDLADLIRAATIVHQVNCGIEARL